MITAHNSQIKTNTMRFDDLFLDEQLLKNLTQLGYEEPTAIQSAAIPIILEGKDILAGAATGTGKSAAFILPILQQLIDEPNQSNHATVLILAPTRELAFQLQHNIKQLSHGLKLNTAIITGGFSPSKQTEMANQHCDILIGTPGRLLNLVSDELLDLTDIDVVVIDEADRMLDMGQGPDVLSLLATIANGFQACLFSATLAGGGIDIFADALLHDAEIVQIDAVNHQADTITQSVYYADNREHKQAILKTLLADDACQRVLIFCNKKQQAEDVAHWLQSQNISAQVMHGDFDQAIRRDKTRKFRQGLIKVMVATDVAARGLDIQDITHVINYDLPIRGDIYIHRIGRTGRAQQSGIAYNLVEPHDRKNLERIEFHLKTSLPIAKIKGLEPNTKKKKAKKKDRNKPRYIAKKDRITEPKNEP